MAILSSRFFSAGGRIIGSIQITLPPSLDWKGIDEKEVYVRYMGGFPPETVHALIESQGESKLICDFDDDSKVPMDFNTYRRKYDGLEDYLNRRCEELGIDRSRKPRNQ